MDVTGNYDADGKTYTLDIVQNNPVTADQNEKQPLHIPFDFELIGAGGEAMALTVDGKAVNSVLDVKAKDNRFVFDGVDSEPVPVLLKNFSSPVKVNFDYSQAQLLHVIAHAGDDFSRWDASQSYYLDWVKALIAGNGEAMSEGFVKVCADLLADESLDKALVAEILTVPAFESVAGNFETVDVEGINGALAQIKKTLGSQLQAQLQQVYQANVSSEYGQSQQDIAARALKNVCLKLLAHATDIGEVAVKQFEASDNMTDTLAVLGACCAGQQSAFDGFMADFEKQWQADALVMDKWFSMHASWQGEEVFDTIEKLYEHPVFNIENPKPGSRFGWCFLGE